MLFRIHSDVKGCVMSPWILNTYLDRLTELVKTRMERRERNV